MSDNFTWSFSFTASGDLVSLAAVFSIVTWGGALRDDTKNGCEGDYWRSRVVMYQVSLHYSQIYRVPSSYNGFELLLSLLLPLLLFSLLFPVT